MIATTGARADKADVQRALRNFCNRQNELARFTVPAVLLGMLGFAVWAASIYIVDLRRVAGIESVRTDAAIDVLGKLGEFLFLIGSLHFLYEVSPNAASRTCFGKNFTRRWKRIST